MRVKFRYNIGKIDEVDYADMQSNSSEDEIKAKFHEVMGIKFHDSYCSYKIVKEGD